MVAFCDKKETPRACAKFETQQVSLSGDTLVEPVDESDMELEHKKEPMPPFIKAKQCPDCIGDEQLHYKVRTFEWCRTTVRNDHFDDHHLPAREAIEQAGGRMGCYHEMCQGVKFEHMDHFRKHVNKVHGVCLRNSHQVEQRRLRKTRHRQLVAIQKAEERSIASI